MKDLLMVSTVIISPIRAIVLLFVLVFFVFIAEGISGEAEPAGDDGASIILLSSDAGEIVEPYILNASLGLDEIDQLRGDAFYEVDKRRDEHFTVETPYLAVVVKGTAFSVSRGQVSVSVSPGGGGVSFSAGQSASVSVTGESGEGSGSGGNGGGNGGA